MKHLVLLALLLVLSAGLLTGCATMPATPDAAATVAHEFLQAWAAGDATALHASLTERARQSISRSTILHYLEQEQIRFEGLGAASEPEPGWVRIPVYNLTKSTEGGERRWPESWLTLYYNGQRWQVAWVEPLFLAAHSAYQNGMSSEALELGRAIAAIDRYHYRGYLEQHFAYRELKRPREAELQLISARERATPAQIPDVMDAWARFKLGLGQPRDAAAAAQTALDGAAPYYPYLYNSAWQADTLVVLGRALLAAGDRAGAKEALSRALETDPQNAQAAMFRYELNKLSPTSGGS